jgi:hypothetical protein
MSTFRPGFTPKKRRQGRGEAGTIGICTSEYLAMFGTKGLL